MEVSRILVGGLGASPELPSSRKKLRSCDKGPPDAPAPNNDNVLLILFSFDQN